MKKSWKVGILLFEDVEVLDFAGPFEVFSVTSYSEDEEIKPFEVRTVSETGGLINAKNGLKVQPDFSFEDAPLFDIVIIPGGQGTRTEISNEKVIQWIKEQSEKVQITASVCTGALLLAKAGLLSAKRATTHWGSYDWMERDFPDVKVERNVKYVDEGTVITSAGISAGINMSFHLVNKLLGADIAKTTAKRMEYDIELTTIQ